MLINKGADLNKQNYEGATALTYAIDHGHLAIAQLLLEKGALTNTKDAKGKTPQDHAEAQENDAFKGLFN